MQVILIFVLIEEVVTFSKENLNFAEVFSLPISIFPIYEGPSGYVLDEKFMV